jgi:hypothetical protein
MLPFVFVVCYTLRMDTKVCYKCLQEKPFSAFFKTGKDSKTGVQRYRGDCRECAMRDTAQWRAKNREKYNSYMGDYRTKNPDSFRAIDMKRNYGLSMDRYREMLSAQAGKCAICDKSPTGKRPLAIDHCHASCQVRGLLCYGCNRNMVLLDNGELLEKSIKYKSKFHFADAP